jgi:enoyl-CoA hydratase/carnithine racemase
MADYAFGSNPPYGLGVVNEIVSREQLRARAREIAAGIAKLPPLTASYTRVALTQPLRRLVDESVGYGLALARDGRLHAERRVACSSASV